MCLYKANEIEMINWNVFLYSMDTCSIKKRRIEHQYTTTYLRWKFHIMITFVTYAITDMEVSYPLMA